MKRIISLIALVIVLMCSVGVTVYAEGTTGVPSLNDVIKENQQAQSEQTTTVNNNSKQTGKGIIGDLGQVANLNQPNESVTKAVPAMQKVISIIVQILCYIITFGLTIRCLLDLAYIALPFLREFLANGRIGNPQAGAGSPNGVNSMGMGGMGGMGGFGSGMGGFGSGMGGFGGGFGGGFNRFGGGGFGGGMMGGGPGMMAERQSHMPGTMGKIQFVSNSALNAVAAETTGGPDGNPVSPLKLYMKDMAVVLVLTPILLTLSVTGVLVQLGFLLGGLLTNVIGGIGGRL